MLRARNPGHFARFSQPDAETDIFTAAREGKISALAALLKADPGLVNSTNAFGQTPLRVAAMSGQTNAIELLLQQGSHWDITSAVLAGQTQAVTDILGREPSAIKVEYYGGSLLHLAAARGDAATTRLLLAKGGDWQAQDALGRSPLGLAKLANHPDVVAILRGQGASENLVDAAYTGFSTNARAAFLKAKNPVFTNAYGLSLSAIAAGTGQA